MKKNPLIYLSMGLRRYGEHPVRANRRGTWEVQCVFRGRARPSSGGDVAPIVGPCLYVFDPEHNHGWTAPKRDTSEVLVFHMHPKAKGWEDRSGFLTECVALNDLDILRLRTLHDWVFPHFLHPRPRSLDVLAGGCVLLADLVDELHQPSGLEGARRRPGVQQRAEEACRCYRETMLSNPTVEQIAGTVGTSASQLRRVFRDAGRPPPATVFRSIQMDYAHRLLVGTGLPVEHIAEELGFSSLSTFSRAFTGHAGCSPRQVRRSETGREIPE